jgi:hypothetical protein
MTRDLRTANTGRCGGSPLAAGSRETTPAGERDPASSLIARRLLTPGAPGERPRSIHYRTALARPTGEIPGAAPASDQV